jgi:hypothetical protein
MLQHAPTRNLKFGSIFAESGHRLRRMTTDSRRWCLLTQNVKRVLLGGGTAGPVLLATKIGDKQEALNGKREWRKRALKYYQG